MEYEHEKIKYKLIIMKIIEYKVKAMKNRFMFLIIKILKNNIIYIAMKNGIHHFFFFGFYSLSY